MPDARTGSGFATCAGLLAVAFSLYADEWTYEQRFVDEVIEFANHNRLNIARLNRDVHANCYIPVTVTAVIRADGTLKDVFVAESSLVPVVDRYFLYVIQQAAPYLPLADHYDSVPEEITITREFSVDVQLWDHGIRSTRPCEPLMPRDSRPDENGAGG